MTSGSPAGWVLFRVVRTNPPADWDFLWFAALGRALPPGVRPERLCEGISMFDSEERARRTARARPHIGRFIARVELPADAPVAVERTGSSGGHYTVWGEAAALRGYVRAVAAV